MLRKLQTDKGERRREAWGAFMNEAERLYAITQQTWAERAAAAAAEAAAREEEHRARAGQLFEGALSLFERRARDGFTWARIKVEELPVARFLCELAKASGFVDCAGGLGYVDISWGPTE